MLRYVWFSATFLGLALFTPSAAASELAQQVQSAGKNDNLLLSEISETVQELTSRCMNLDKVEEPDASDCWRHAATAVNRFLVIGEPFAQQLRQLQAAWLQRSTQIKDRDKSSVQTASAPPSVRLRAEAVEPSDEAKPSRSKPRLVKAKSKTRLAHSTKKGASAKKSKKFKLAKKLQREQQALKTIEVKKVKAVPAAVRQPVEQYSARQADLRAIRDRLKRIERKLGCTSLKCEIRTGKPQNKTE